MFIFCPDEIDPGADAAFRVVVMEARGLNDSSPVKGARVKINLEGKNSSYRLIDSRTNTQGKHVELRGIGGLQCRISLLS